MKLGKHIYSNGTKHFFSGLGALPGLMLDLGLLKIVWVDIFLFLAPAVHYPNPYPNPTGQR